MPAAVVRRSRVRSGRGLRPAIAVALVGWFVMSTAVGLGVAHEQPLLILVGLVPAGVAGAVLIQRVLPELVLAAMAVLPAVPSITSPITALFTGGIAIGTALRGPGHRIPPAVVAFLGFATLSVVWGDATQGDFVRGMVPFAFLLSVPLWGDTPARRIEIGLLAAGAVLSIRELATYATGVERVTYLTLDFIEPLHLVAGLICFHRLVRRRRVDRREVAPLVGLYALVSVGVVLTQARGLAFAYALGHVVIVLGGTTGARAASRTSIPRVAMVLALLLVAGLTVGRPFVVGLESRIRGGGVDAGIGGRASELDLALREWRRSPVVGNGLGHRYYNAVAAPDDPAGVGYVHNALGYLLKDLGVFGALAWLLVFAAGMAPAPRRAGASAWSIDDVVFRRATLLALLMLSLSSAVFRSIHFNVLLAVLLARTHHTSPDTTNTTTTTDATAV